MNFSQKLGIFCLVIITVVYVYFSFFAKGEFTLPKWNTEQNQGEIGEETPAENPEVTPEPQAQEEKNAKPQYKTVKIYVTDSNGKIRSVNRKCNVTKEKSCFSFAIKQLIAAPTEWEKKKGLSSEIPPSTKILSVREGDSNVLIDLSSAFESGGGAESIYTRVEQLIKTAKANTKYPVFLYINGKQADVIGGEGVMIKQPLTERSLDD